MKMVNNINKSICHAIALYTHNNELTGIKILQKPIGDNVVVQAQFVNALNYQFTIGIGASGHVWHISNGTKRTIYCRTCGQSERVHVDMENKNHGHLFATIYDADDKPNPKCLTCGGGQCDITNEVGQ